MKPGSFAFNLWVKVIVLNALLFGMAMGVKVGGWGLIVGIICLFVGFIGSLPLLPFITWFVKLSTRLPYAQHARMVWLAFAFCVQVFMFCIVVAIVLSGIIRPGDTIDTLAATAVSAALLSAITSWRTYGRVNITPAENQPHENAV